MKRAGFVALALGIAAVGSCKGNEEVTLVLLDPCEDEAGVSFKESSVYTEILVVKNGCPSDEDLALGKVEGIEFQGVAESGGKLPSVGDLAKGKYGFVVLAKDANCGVIGFGCTAADLENIREVRIAVRAWTSGDTCQPLSGGKCPAPKSCNEGRCVESGDGGTGCDLTVLAEGTLPDPLTAGSQVTGPGVVSTPSGFVIGFREYASDGTLNATLVPISDSGEAGTPQRHEIAPCASTAPNDGIGMAFKGTTGLLAASLPDCGDGKGAGAAFVPFGGDAKIGDSLSLRNEQAPFSDLTLARVHAVAPAIASNEWEFHYRRVSGGAGSIDRSIIQGNGFKAGFSIEYPFVGSDPTFAQVATAESARGFLGGGIVTEAGTATTVLLNRVEPTAGEAAPTTLGELSLPGASWATITAWNDRVAAGVPGTSGLTWSAAAVTTSSVTSLVDQASLGSGTVASADMVAHGENLLFALGKAGSIDVHRLTGATGTITQTPEDSETITSSGFDGSHVAVAAGRARLAVVWLTKQAPGASDSTGGYALLQCAEE